MANGGIMRLKDGSDEEGVVAEEFVDEYQDFFDAYDSLDPEKFMNLTDEDQQVYIDDYQKRLQFKEDLRGSAAQSFLTQGLARFTDAINIVPETIVDTYRNIKYGDIGKAAGFSEPFDVRPDGEEFYGLGVDVGDPTFYEELNTPRNTTGPSIDDILGSRPEPPEPPQQEDKEEAEIIDEVIQGEEEEEERPGFVESAYGALKSFYDVGDTDLEKRASRAARGRRKYGTSYQQAYNDELLKLQLGEAKVKEYESVSNARGRSELQQGMEYLAEQFPQYKNDPTTLFSLFRSLKSNSGAVTAADINDSYQQILKVIIADKDGEQSGQWKVDKDRDPINTEKTFDQWAVKRAMILSGMEQDDSSSNSSVAVSIGADGEKII